MDQNKYNYAMKARTLATQAAMLMDQLGELVAVWDDRGYGPGAANELRDIDLVYAGNPMGDVTAVPTPNDLYAFIIAASQLGKFIENDPGSVPGPYSATFNKLRQDI